MNTHILDTPFFTLIKAEPQVPQSLPVTSLYGLSSMTYTLQDLRVVKSCCSKSPMVSC